MENKTKILCELKFNGHKFNFIKDHITQSIGLKELTEKLKEANDKMKHIHDRFVSSYITDERIILANDMCKTHQIAIDLTKQILLIASKLR